MTRWALDIGVAIVLCSRPLDAQQSPPGEAAPTSPSAAAATTPARPDSSATSDRLPDSVFHRLDKNHDKVISEAELAAPEAAPYAAKLKQADRDGNNRITWEEFNRLGELPFYRDPRTAAALFLILGFAAFCLFLDGVFDPDHRDYFWLSIVGTVVCVALAFLLGKQWFLEDTPFLGYVAAAPALIIVTAALFGATRETEQPETVTTGPIVYQVGKPTAATATKPGQPTQPRKSGPPVRTPRPAPVPRPPVPERRPQPPPQAAPRPAPPAPRPGPPRPPGSRPPGGPKPPPSKS